MSKETIKVKIKTWEAMKKEFGLDRDGDIRMGITNLSYLKTMEKSMPNNRIIQVYKTLNGYYRWDLVGDYWNITNNMIERFLNTKNTWLVKSIIEIREVSNKTIEELREEYPNCLYYETSSKDWIK
jgi:hypothetical protein